MNKIITFIKTNLIQMSIGSFTLPTWKYMLIPPRQINYPVDFDDELKIGDVKYDNMT